MVYINLYKSFFSFFHTMNGGNCKWAELRGHENRTGEDHYCILQDKRDIIIGDLIEKRCSFTDYNTCLFYTDREKMGNKRG